jgi:hypothetical protein
LEPGRTIRRDSTLEAACEIVTTSPITKWGNWAQNNATKLTPATTPSFGKIVCDLATIFGYAAVDAVKNWNKKEQESRALSARQGSFYSYVPYRVLFDQIAYQLSEPIGKHAFSIAVDRQLMQMSASVAWHDYGSEELSGMPQRLDLKLRFVPGQSGTRIDYEWLHYYQVAPGAAANQLVSITNGWIKHIALGAPPR